MNRAKRTYRVRHNVDRHFDSTLKTNQIKFLPSRLVCLTEVKKSPFAVSI